MRRIGTGSALGALVLAVSCSLVVPSELDEIRCGSEGAIGPPACDPGFVCAGHVCARCTLIETCGDGFDNDCDGGVDNGCSAFGGTGGALPDGSGASGGSVPDASTGGVGGVGGAGTGGDAATGGAAGAVGGAGGSVGGAPGIGSPCTDDEQCDPNDFCVPNPAIVGVPTSGMCTRGCCTSSNCGGGNVCFVTPSGNNLCFPGAAVNRPALGTKSPGIACGAPGECRSGLCEGGFCVDACCSNVDCGGQLPHCTLGSVGGAQKMAFHCGKTGDLSFNQLCFGSSDCQSNYCLATEVRCTSRCCKKSDCTAAGSNWSCVYVNDATYATPVCAPAGSTGPEPIGAPCSAHNQCQTGRCVSVTGLGDFCSDACCRDEDCGDIAQFGCRALNSNGTGLLLCVPL